MKERAIELCASEPLTARERKRKPRTRIKLNLCKPCRAAIHAPPAPSMYRGEWLQLPRLCPECGAKVAQAIRILTSDVAGTDAAIVVFR